MTQDDRIKMPDKGRQFDISELTASGACKKPFIDFSGFLSSCELNYLKLFKVFPQVQNLQIRQIEMYFLNGYQSQLEFNVVERTNHTTVLSLSLFDQNAYFKQAEMQIRVYHDMKVVKVLSVQSVDVRKSSIRKQDSGILKPSERLQASRLLSEWLDHCIEFGVVPVDMPLHDNE